MRTLLRILGALIAVAAVSAADVAELEALTWEMECRGLIEPNFGAWIERARPGMRWDAPHFRLMQARLDDVTAGETLRLMLQVSGRHGKTETVTSYGAYRLHKDPATRILGVTYSQPQARKLSRVVKRLARAVGVPMSQTVKSVDEWETVEGGGFRAVGVGAGTASINADLILIDDPIGNRAEAESQAHRERVWDSITTDILARAEPHTSVVFSMPRWHSDDPAGRLQDRHPGRWTIVDLPGRSIGRERVAEGVFREDQLGRPEGAVLWPEMRPESWHEAMRIELGEYGYASFIQCRPTPRGGGMFKWDWWKLLEAVPASGPMVRYWDTAGTDATGENDPDYTAGALGCRMADGRTAIVDVARFRLSVAARDARIVEIAEADRKSYGQRVRWWFESESGVAGKDRTAALVRKAQAAGIACYSEPATGKKEIRAEPLASAAEAGNVLLCPGDWRDPFRLEAAQFPTGAHDDQVDAAAGMFNKLAEVRLVIGANVDSPWG